MAGTPTMVPLARIRPSNTNPRRGFDEERMAELVASVKRHGIITPLTLAPDGDDRFVIVAGERRYRAARAARLREVPAYVREDGDQTLAVAVAENVIRADLSPIEEALAYQALRGEQGDLAGVARLVGRSERLIAERLDLLRLPGPAQELIASRRVPLACAPTLGRIAERDALLAHLVAAWLAERPQDAHAFPLAPGPVVDDVLRASWSDDGEDVTPTAYAIGYRGPLTPPGTDRVAAVLARLGEHAAPIAAAHAALPEIPEAGEHDWQARQARDQRERDCFALDEQDADAARAFGCLLELPGHHDRTHAYATDPAWLADRLAQRIEAHARAITERAARTHARPPAAPADDPERERRKAERDRLTGERAAARARNLDLGAALARWQPKLDADAVRLLGQLVLDQHGLAAAWAQRLLVEQPTETSTSGRVTVRYPRGAEAEQHHHAHALATLARARTPEDALAVVLRLLVALHLADTAGLANADRQGIHEPHELATNAALDRLARKVAPASVRRHLAARQPASDSGEEALDQAA